MVIKSSSLAIDYPLPSTIGPCLWRTLVLRLELPPQQARVLACVARGLPDKQISAELQVQRPTVRTHLRRIFERTGVRGRARLIAHVMEAAQQIRQHPVIIEDDKA